MCKLLTIPISIFTEIGLHPIAYIGPPIGHLCPKCNAQMIIYHCKEGRYIVCPCGHTQHVVSMS